MPFKETFSKLENPKEGAAIQIIIRKPTKEISFSRGREIARRMQQGEHFEKIIKGSSLSEGLRGAGKEMVKAVLNPGKKDEQFTDKNVQFLLKVNKR